MGLTQVSWVADHYKTQHSTYIDVLTISIISYLAHDVLVLLQLVVWS